jgi:hypothetical protein
MSVPPQRLTRSMRSKSLDTALRDILHHIDLAANFSTGSTPPASSTTSRPCTPSRDVWKSFPKLHAVCRMI